MESILTDLAHELALGTVVLIDIDLGSIASRASAVVGDVAFGASPYRLYGLVAVLVPPFKIFHEVAVIPWIHMEDQREFIHFELLVFRRMGIIESPLL